MNEKPQSNTVWEDRLKWFKCSSEYRAVDRIDSQSMEFEWNIFLGFTTLQLSHKVQELLSRLSIFVSMFNDISWRSKDNTKRMRVKCSTRLSTQRDLEQDNGHSSDLDQKKVVLQQ